MHIEEFECVARDTKLGKEEITRDIPNVGEEALKDLDESGIVRIGAEVSSGDILVGKITPKGETQLSPEEKLLRAIFGEKAGDVRDTSLKVPPGVNGMVIDARVFARKGTEKDERSLQIEETERPSSKRTWRTRSRSFAIPRYDRVRKYCSSAALQPRSWWRQGSRASRQGRQDHRRRPRRDPAQVLGAHRGRQGQTRIKTDAILEQARGPGRPPSKMLFQEKIDKLGKGDELPPGVIKMVKVYVAIKRKLQVGDKMAGRHGNKGVVSRILPEEDMPYLPDGTPVDIVLNPLGVPSRMNVGQILETHLGWAGHLLGKRSSRRWSRRGRRVAE